MLKQRILTACILLPLVFALIWITPEPAYQLFLSLIMIGIAYEFATLYQLLLPARLVYLTLLTFCATLSYRYAPNALLIAGIAWWFLACVLLIWYPKLKSFWASKALMLPLSFLILIPAWIAFLKIHQMPDGPWNLTFLLLLVFAMDTGAYTFGRLCGRHLMAPHISPKKTWEGLLGGTICVLALGFWLFRPSVSAAIILFFIAGASVFGDLIESIVKRVNNAKDSGAILPGHGGLYDRLDSILPTIVIWASYLLLVKS